MPFISHNSCETDLYQNTKCPENVNVPASDLAAWELYPQYRWVYNRMNICTIQKIKHGPHGLAPDSYPVFSKPIYGLMGTSTTSMKFNSQEEAENNYQESNFWMENLDGNRLIIDLVLVHGSTEWWSKSIKYRNGLDYWHVNVQDGTHYTDFLDTNILKHFSKFTGYLSIELIGSTVTEIHLGLNERLVGFYGKRWLTSIVSLYEKQKWYPVDTTLAGYSAKFICDKKVYEKEGVANEAIKVTPAIDGILVNSEHLEAIHAIKDRLLVA